MGVCVRTDDRLNPQALLGRVQGSKCRLFYHSILSSVLPVSSFFVRVFVALAFISLLLVPKSFLV